MRFLDLFAGIGGFRLGMERAGHECIGFCEIDKFARASYKAIHDTTGEIELHDITTVSDEFIRSIGNVDAICGGFPCQAFSIAGKRQGFEDTRGTLFFEIARFASILKPRILFLENVKGLLHHDKGRTFETILETLEELGYYVEWQVLNSKHFGVPQNRERVFIIGHSRGTSGRKIFPIGTYNEQVIELPGERLTTNTLTARYSKSQSNGSYIIANQPSRVIHVKEATKKGYAVATVGDSVNFSHPNSKTRRGRVGQQIANTILTGTEQGIVTEDLRIRKLTPRECWRLQGFPDYAFDRAQQVNSDSQLYKQAGNSVTVNVIEAIARELWEHGHGLKRPAR